MYMMHCLVVMDTLNELMDPVSEHHGHRHDLQPRLGSPHGCLHYLNQKDLQGVRGSRIDLHLDTGHSDGHYIILQPVSELSFITFLHFAQIFCFVLCDSHVLVKDSTISAEEE